MAACSPWTFVILSTFVSTGCIVFLSPMLDHSSTNCKYPPEDGPSHRCAAADSIEQEPPAWNAGNGVFDEIAT
jgi:hypothetical protein